MKIFFIASPRAANKEPELYSKINKILSKDHKLLGTMVEDWTKGNLEDFYSGNHDERVEHYKKTMDLVKKADAVFVEVSLHSMSMGFIVNKALEIGKPVVALYKKGCDPYFFSGIEDQKLQVVEYHESDLEKIVEGAIDKVESLVDVRFNFFVNPKILTFLDWIAKEKKIPRSVFLRDLIEKEMKKEKDFKG